MFQTYWFCFYCLLFIKIIIILILASIFIFYNNIKQIKENGQYTSNSKLQTDTSNKSLSDNYVSKFISKKEEETNETETNVEESNINVSEEIRNFYNLMKEGIITEEEFEEKKKELLKL